MYDWQKDLPGFSDLRQRDWGVTVIKDRLRRDFDGEEYKYRWEIYIDEIYQRLFLLQECEYVARGELELREHVAWNVLVQRYFCTKRS